MNKIMKDVALIAALGGVSYCAYSWMSPSNKKKITKDIRRTSEDICDVREDMQDIAHTIKETF